MKLRSRAPALLIPALVPLLIVQPASVAGQISVERERLSAPPPGLPRLDLSFGFGTSFSTDWSDQVILETQDPSGARTTRLLLPEVGMAPGPAVGGAVAYWRGPLGARLQAAFTRACLTAGATRCADVPQPETRDRFVTELDVWTYGVQGVVSMTRGRVARFVRPYLLLGGAGVTFDPEEPVPAGLAPATETAPPAGGGDVIVIDGTTNLVLALDALGFETRFALELGAGLDLRVPLGAHGLGVRLEVVDQLMGSPIGIEIVRLGGGLGERAVAVATERPLVHTVRATIGAVIDLGLPVPPPPDVAAMDP